MSGSTRVLCIMMHNAMWFYCLCIVEEILLKCAPIEVKATEQYVGTLKWFCLLYCIMQGCCDIMASGCTNHIVCGSKAPEQYINMWSIVLFGLVHNLVILTFGSVYKNHYYIMTIQVKATKYFYYMYK